MLGIYKVSKRMCKLTRNTQVLFTVGNGNEETTIQDIEKYLTYLVFIYLLDGWRGKRSKILF